MGKRQERLKAVFKQLGMQITERTVPVPKHADVRLSIYGDEVQRIYQTLSGIKSVFPLNLRKWDIEVNGIAVELDEDLHFNRYRRITLGSPVYRDLPFFPHREYMLYCVEHESACLSAGGYGQKWTNSSAEQQFGPASPPKDLTGNGAPRWKQRAFYDFVKDLTPLLIGVPVARVAIWDTVNVGGSAMSVEKALSTIKKVLWHRIGSVVRELTLYPTKLA